MCHPQSALRLCSISILLLMLFVTSCSQGNGRDAQESLQKDIQALSKQVKSLQTQQQETAKTQEALNKELEKRLSEIEQDRRVGETPADKVKRAIIEVRTLATAVQSYSTDFNYYPENPPKGAAQNAGYRFSQIADLGQALAPNYIKSLPAWDPWGNAYLYWTSSKKDHFMVLCTGAAGKLAFNEQVTAALKNLAETNINGVAITSPCIETNIIWYDSTFVLMPDGQLRKCGDTR